MATLSTIMIGPQVSISPNVIYAMPARATKGYSSSTTLEKNMTNSTLGWAAVTVTVGEFTTAAPFLRDTTSTTVQTVRLVAL